jgi:hypothetical protein
VAKDGTLTPRILIEIINQNVLIISDGIVPSVEDVDWYNGNEEMDGRSKYLVSWWYEPGDWVLPRWWTDGPPHRDNGRYSHQELENFYSSPFVVNVLGHKGGITTLPTLMEKGKGGMYEISTTK